MSNTKEVIKIVNGYATQDGAGVSLIRVVGHDDTMEADPFLLLDAFDSTNPADYIKGFPMHPHRGIETITYLIEGQIDHEDSLGNKESIRSGQAQWMTAGSGIMHEEMPQPSERLFGLQFWLNLPAKDKMTEPQYFDITEDKIGTAQIDGGTVRVIAGDYNGVKGAQSNFVNTTLLDVSLEPNKEFAFSTETENKVMIYIFEGDGAFGSQAKHIGIRTAAMFGEGSTFVTKAGKDGLRFVLVAGRPLKEPIAWGGPVVMNTEEELNLAFAEMRRGTFVK